jgi:hypothetical protein
VKVAWRNPRFFWPAVILTAESVFPAHVRPSGLLEHSATPQLDPGGLGSDSKQAGWDGSCVAAHFYRVWFWRTAMDDVLAPEPRKARKEW